MSMSHRTYEPDPGLVNRLAVDLLTRQARDISTTRAAVELVQEYPELTQLGLGDSELDDLRDAVYEACGRAVHAIPDGTTMTDYAQKTVLQTHDPEDGDRYVRVLELGGISLSADSGTMLTINSERWHVVRRSLSIDVRSPACILTLITVIKD